MSLVDIPLLDEPNEPFAHDHRLGQLLDEYSGVYTLWYECKTGVARTSHMKKNGRYYGQIRCYCNRSTRCGSNRLTPLLTASNPGLSCTGHMHAIRRECSLNPTCSQTSDLLKPLRLS